MPMQPDQPQVSRHNATLAEAREALGAFLALLMCADMAAMRSEAGPSSRALGALLSVVADRLDAGLDELAA